MKPSSGSAYLDDNITQFNTIHCILFILSKEAMLSTKITIFEKNCQIRAIKNISGLVKVTVTSPVGLMKCFLNVEPCRCKKCVAYIASKYKTGGYRLMFIWHLLNFFHEDDHNISSIFKNLHSFKLTTSCVSTRLEDRSN